jgi:membrane associated rhomboid family serine protease
MPPIKDNIPLARAPLVTLALVAVNVLAYLLATRSGHGGSFLGGPSDRFDVRYGAIPYELTHPGEHCQLVSAHARAILACQGRAGAAVGTVTAKPATWVTLFASMFVHASFLHLLGNVLFLAIFGPAVEDAVGRVRYPAFYVLGGLVALGAQVVVEPNSTAPVLGSSGALAAVLGAYMLLYPRARVLAILPIVFFMTVVEIPAFLFVLAWFGEQLWLGLEGLSTPGGVASSHVIAYVAEVGGFLFGALAIRPLVKRRGWAGGADSSSKPLAPA